MWFDSYCPHFFILWIFYKVKNVDVEALIRINCWSIKPY